MLKHMLRSDDGELHSTEWLGKIGFRCSHDPQRKWYWDIEVDRKNDWILWLRLYAESGEVALFCASEEQVAASDESGITLARTIARTRGDVRRLCDVFGVVLAG